MTPPGARPTREDIEAVLVQAAVDTLAVQTETVVKRSDFYRTAAERLSARLQPARERMEQQAHRPKCLYCTFGEDADFTAEDLKKHIESECDFHPLRALRADLEAAHKQIDGLGYARHDFTLAERLAFVLTEPDFDPDKKIAALKTDLAACAAVLKKIADADILPLHGRREVRAALARCEGRR